MAPQLSSRLRALSFNPWDTTKKLSAFSALDVKRIRRIEEDMLGGFPIILCIDENELRKYRAVPRPDDLVRAGPLPFFVAPVAVLRTELHS